MVQKKLFIAVFCMIGLIMAGLLQFGCTPVQAATYVAHWSFDEGTGSIVNDSSGNGHTGTINGAVWGNGITGKCLMFNGNSYVQIPRVSDLDINGPITISAWVKPMVVNETMVFISKANSSTQGYDMGFHDTAGLFARVGGENDPNRAVSKLNVLKANEWQHVAVTFDGATERLYYNGTMVESKSVSSSSGIVATDLFIGKPADRYSLYFKGWMDEVKIANTCLSDQIILEEYNLIKCGTGLLGRYFDNMDLTNLKMVRVDSTVNYDWGYNAPGNGMGDETFSIRWSGEIQPSVSGIYTFYTTSDDGVKLTIDNRTIINKWVDQPFTENSGNIYLTANEKYKIDLIYYDNSLSAKVKLEWYCPDGQPREIVPVVRLYPEKNRAPYLRNGLKTEYCNSINTCEVCNLSSVIDFDWGTNSPYPTVNPDNFSVVWSGFLQPTYSGTYTFYTTLGTSDTASLTIAGNGVGGPIELIAGQVYPFRLDFSDNQSNARIKLEWSCNGVFARQLVPSQCFFYELGTGLTASYYDGYTITSGNLTPVGIKKVRIDPQVNFNWGQGSPEPGIDADTFAVVWSGYIETNVAGEYTFYATSDDGVQLCVGILSPIIDNLTDHAPTENTGTIYLAASSNFFWLAYYENTGGAQIQLEWSGPGFTRQPIPTEKLYPSYQKNNEIVWDQFLNRYSLAKNTWTYSISPGTIDDFAGRKAEQDAIIDMGFNFWESVVPFKFTRVDTGGEIQINFVDNYQWGGAYANSICGDTITFANKFNGADIDWTTPNRLFTTTNHELAHILGMVDLRSPDDNSEAGYYDKAYYAQRLPYNYSLMDYDNPLGIFFPALCGYDIAVIQSKYGVPDHNPIFRILVNNDDIPATNWEEASLMIRSNGGGNATDFYGIIPARPLMDTKPIYRFRVNYGTFTDNIISSNPDFNSTAGEYLGEIYTAGGGGRVPLYLYCKQTGQHFISTTYYEPDNTIVSRILLGYITPRSAM